MLKPTSIASFSTGVRPARQLDDGLAGVAGHEVPLAVGRELEPVGADLLAAGDAHPAAVGVPLPDVLRRRARRREPAVRQRDHRVQAEPLGGHGAADPGQGRRLAARVDLEHLHRLPLAVPHDVERVQAALAGAQAHAVGAELLRRHAGAAGVHRRVVPRHGRRALGREQPDRVVVPAVGGREVAVVDHAGHDHPGRIRDRDQVLGADRPADELDVPVRLALRGGGRRQHRQPGHRQERRSNHLSRHRASSKVARPVTAARPARLLRSPRRGHAGRGQGPAGGTGVFAGLPVPGLPVPGLPVQ